MTAGKPMRPDATNPLAVAVEERDRDTLTAVKNALAANNVMLAYQPIVQTARPDRPAFYEGLIRILDPAGRVIPARQFIDVIEAQEIGRIVDCLALEHGLNALRRNPLLRLAINMSARSIGYPRWTKTLQDGLDGDPTIGARLILEMTEASAMTVPEIVQVFMGDLQDRGISFALDDFGAGYTSFRYLRDFYFDIVKIDGQFIQGVSKNPDNQVLVQALLSISRHFDMVSVAEFVEDAADAAFLTRIGVDCMQGYFFGSPAPKPQWRPREEDRKAG